MADLERQLDELTVLQSCYNPDELSVSTPPASFALLQASLEFKGKKKKGKNPLPLVAFELILASGNGCGKVAINVELPSTYPSQTLPTFSFRLEGGEPLSRQAADLIRASLDEELKDSCGDECCLSGISFLLGKIEEALTEEMNKKTLAAESKAVKAELREEHAWKRCFFWSNHLLNGRQHKKEAKVRDLAKNFGLTGCIYFGRPGIICVEGPSLIVDEFAREAGRAGKQLKVKKTQSLPNKQEDAFFPKFVVADALDKGDDLDIKVLQENRDKLHLTSKFKHILGLEDLNDRPVRNDPN